MRLKVDKVFIYACYNSRMKTTLTLFFFLSSLIAQEYQQGKIDMHGGDYDASHYSQKHSFSCMSDFLDRNTSKKVTVKKQK